MKNQKTIFATSSLFVIAWICSLAGVFEIEANENREAAANGLYLRIDLGHACEQKESVEHLTKTLKKAKWVKGVRTFAGKGAKHVDVDIANGAVADLQQLRENLSKGGVGVTGMRLKCDKSKAESLRLFVEFPAATLCSRCRETILKQASTQQWIKDAKFNRDRLKITPQAGMELAVGDLIRRIESHGHVPQSVFILRASDKLPALKVKARPPAPEPKTDGTDNDALIQLEFEHVCPGAEAALLKCLNDISWASRTAVVPRYPGVIDKERLHPKAKAVVAVGERKWADVVDLLQRVRRTGFSVSGVHLTGFGSLRVRTRFDYLCGETKKNQKGKKYFQSSKETRKAVESAFKHMPWLNAPHYTEAGTKPNFAIPRREIRVEFMLDKPNQAIDLKELLNNLNQVGFSPVSVRIARMAGGVPFGFPIPGDVRLVDPVGKTVTSKQLRKPGRPLVLAFFPLSAKKYRAEPRHFARMKEVSRRYADRVDFVAISRKKDSAADVRKLWKNAGMPFPVYHDAQGKLRHALHATVNVAPPHMFVLDAKGGLRYAGEFADGWVNPEKVKRVYLTEAIERVLTGKFTKNDAVFYNSPKCTCSAPTCKCPKCGCGGPCRCGCSTGRS